MAHHLIGRARTYNPGAFNNNMLWDVGQQQPRFRVLAPAQRALGQDHGAALSVGNWTGVGLHLRGNVEGFMNAASKHKKLRIHSGTHFHPFHSRKDASTSCASSTTG